MLQINPSSDYISTIVLEWYPQPDITTYELAQCLSIILRPYSLERESITIPENLTRHFKVAEL